MQDFHKGRHSEADASFPLFLMLCLQPTFFFTHVLVIFAPTPNPASLPERKLVESSRKVSSRPKPLSILRSLEEKYVAAMKKLQFGEYTCLLWIYKRCMHIFLLLFFYALHMGAPKNYAINHNSQSDFLLSPNTHTHTHTLTLLSLSPV